MKPIVQFFRKYILPREGRTASVTFSPSALEVSISPEEALKRLLEGNQRYVNDVLEHPNHSLDRRQAISAKQSPFAIILGCADSRVSPEIIFDQGVGDLFVVRVAGNVIGPLEIDSIEYAARYLNSAVILVLGHESCGAVTAVTEGNTKEIEAIAELIQPAVREARRNFSPESLLTRAVKINALRMRSFLLDSPLLKKLVREKNLEIYAAYYHLHTGKVELLTPAHH